jgi:hypothetical protein
MPFAENFAPFFNVAEFASVATLDGVALSGIFDRAYAEPFGNDVQGSTPTLLCAAAAAPNVAHGQTLVVAGGTYKVCGVEPDGTGTVLLRLEKQ